ncbi:MAG: hypothetical protein QM736_06370 [Vicinamibacterales bacterium]
MSRPIRVLELRSVRGTGGGPEKTILQGAARADRDRFAVTVCYLRDVRDDVFEIDAVAGNLPVDYIEVRERHSFDPGVWGQLRRIIRDRKIDIVHAHDVQDRPAGVAPVESGTDCSDGDGSRLDRTLVARTVVLLSG